MLKITIPAGEQFDELNSIFISTKECTIQLEHSLVSISKWESKWCKPFMSKKEKTFEETIDYVRCMTITQNIDPNVYLFISNNNIDEINKYVEAPMTASWITKRNETKSNEQITSELIYYWMISLNIPFECQKWHLNRLLMLIEIINAKNQPTDKMSKKDILRRNAELNAKRRKSANTAG